MISGCVGVRERAADGTAVADLRVADLAGGVGEERGVLLHERVRLDRAMGREGADGEMVAAVVHVGQVVEPADVDDDRRVGEAELHHRQERVTARHQLRLVAVLGERGEGGVGRVGPDVVERNRDHLPPPAASSTALTMLW